MKRVAKLKKDCVEPFKWVVGKGCFEEKENAAPAPVAAPEGKKLKLKKTECLPPNVWKTGQGCFEPAKPSTKPKVANQGQSSFKSLHGEHFEGDRDFCAAILARRRITESELPFPLEKINKDIDIPYMQYQFFWKHNFEPKHLMEPPAVRYETVGLTVTQETNREKDKLLTFDFPLEWFKQSNLYIQTLSLEDKFTVLAYSQGGDQIANAWLLGKPGYYQKSQTVENVYYPLFFPIRKILRGDLSKYVDPSKKVAADTFKIIAWSDDLSQAYIELSKLLKKSAFKQDLFDHAIADYVKDLTRIIANAPPVPRDCILWRGVGTRYFSKEGSNIFHSETFMSTTYSPFSAQIFTDEEQNCCIKKILVPKGTHCLWMVPLSLEPQEHEVLLGPGLKFKILQTDFKVIQRNSFTHDICNKNDTPMSYTTMQLLE